MEKDISLFSILNLSVLPLLLVLLPSLSHSAERCHPEDKRVLLKIKQDLHNPYHLASWDPKTDCCGWYVVECDPNTNRIRALTVFSGQISGQIPDAVGDLPYLEDLVFRKLTNLTGTIPRSVTKLTRLTSLRVSWTNISGPVPSYLSELKNLTYLDLAFNDLSGPIPPSFGTFTKLGALHLDRNNLTGQIPDSFGNFEGSVPDLYLSHNQLSGPVPKSLGKMKFVRLDISRNKLAGDASFLFGADKVYETLDLSRNMFQFDMAKVDFPKKSLISLDLNHNKIYGSLPKALAKLENIQQLNVSYNRLCGPIPTSERLKRLDYSTYFHNRCLCGSPLPPCK